ncbi:MAG TPA: GNAT family N-acetyltransferase [Terriglobia bacterium]|nr:GNAT family N-acetyltransferase [Terriglobia bacterium]
MEISIREWQSQDLSGIQAAWLDFCRNAARSDMSLKSDSERTMTAWLNSRFKDHEALGFIAETMDAQAGFLIGRIGHWESVPPVVEPRKMGIIDAVYVNERFRRQGIGRRLVERSLQTMRERHAVAVETIYEAWSEPSSELWQGAGFAPWMVHAYKML